MEMSHTTSGYPQYDLTDGYIGGQRPKRPVRVGKIRLPNKQAVINVQVTPKRKTRSATRSKSGSEAYFPHPFAFIDHGYKLLPAAANHEFVFCFDAFATEGHRNTPDTFLHLLSRCWLDAAKTIEPTMRRKITEAFLPGHTMNFDGTRTDATGTAVAGAPFVYKEAHSEGVNGVLYEIPAGVTQKALSPILGMSTKDEEIVVPGKGRAKAWVLMPSHGGSALGQTRPNAGILAAMRASPDLNTTWKGLLASL